MHKGADFDFELNEEKHYVATVQDSDDVSQMCLKCMFSVLSGKAGLLQEERWWIWFKTATLVSLLFIFFFLKDNQEACQTGKAGGKKGRFFWTGRTVCAGW